MFEPTIDDDGTIDYPYCHVCGRVLSEDDHTDEAGTDGVIFWDQYYHSPEGLEELAGIAAWQEFEADRVKTESLERLQAVIDDAVRDALRSRGL